MALAVYQAFPGIIFLLLLLFVVAVAVVLAVKSPEAAAALAVGLGAFLFLMALAQSGRLKLAGLAMVALAAAAPAAAAQIVPLQWVDTGKEVLPGTYVSISVHAEGCVTCGGLADAGFMVDNKKFGIAQDGRTIFLFFEGHPHPIGELPWIKRTMYDAVFEVRLYCPESAPVGEQPRPGYLWMEVYSPSHGYKHLYLVRDTGKAPNILWFAESNSILKGETWVGEVERFQECEGYDGDQVSPGEGSGLPELRGLLERAKLALLALAALILAPLILSLVQASIGLYKTIKT